MFIIIIGSINIIFIQCLLYSINCILNNVHYTVYSMEYTSVQKNTIPWIYIMNFTPSGCNKALFISGV